MASRLDTFQLAQAFLQRGDPTAAARACEALLRTYERDAAARHLRGRCLAALGRLDDAASDFRRALKIDSNYFPARADLGFALAALGRHRQAAQMLQSALGQDDRPAELHFCLGQCHLAGGDLQAAATSFQAAITRNPGFPDAYNNLGVTLDRLGRLEEALQCFEQARSIQPGAVRIHLNIADALRRLGRTVEAAATLQHTLALDPGNVELLCELSEVSVDAGMFVEAETAARAAVSRSPDSARAHAALGAALLGMRDPVRAVAALESALALDPKLAYVAVNLGEARRNLGRLDAAAAAYQSALAIDTAIPEAHIGLGRTFIDQGYALESQGMPAAAVASFQRALDSSPGSAEALAGLVSCAFRLCDWNGIDSALARLRATPEGLEALHPFLLLASGTPPQQQRLVLERRGLHIHGESLPPLYPREKQRLRIAYISPDFREHAVAHAIVEVIERHDRSRVEPIGVSLSGPDGSAIGARVRSAFETLIDAASMSDRDLARRLRDLEIDIAVDLAGFTVGARTGVFAARCAPVQVNYLGFPASMGAPFMDCIIADPVVIPASQEGAYTERVVRLPHCYLPWDSARGRLRPSIDRVEAGLPTSGFVFCGFNNSYKITREAFQIWVGLLRDVPDSVLWLRSMNCDAAQNLRAAATELGICSDRLIFAAHVEQIDPYLARLGLADLFLDTFPYNAHTTAADALCAGVPVLTCQGDSFASRVGASLLTSAGLPELICATAQDYRAKALQLATSPAELSGVRSRLMEARSSSPVFDTGLYARNLEALYFSIWHDARAGSSPRSATG